MTDTVAPRPASPLDWLERACLAAAGVCLVGVVAAQGFQVVSRYVIGHTPSWTDPVAVVLKAHAAMLGAAVGARRGTHFAFTALAEATPAPVRSLLRQLSPISLALCGAGLMAFGAQLAAANWDVKLPGAPLPTGVRFLPLCVGDALMAVFAVEKSVAIAKPGASEPA